jgi:hypothetical protein
MQTRPHAEAALANLNNSILHGSELRIGYGKTVTLPAQPIYPPPRHVQQLRERVVNAVSSRGRDPRGEHSWGRGLTSEDEKHRVRRSPRSEGVAGPSKSSMPGIPIRCTI